MVLISLAVQPDMWSLVLPSCPDTWPVVPYLALVHVAFQEEPGPGIHEQGDG